MGGSNYLRYMFILLHLRFKHQPYVSTRSPAPRGFAETSPLAAGKNVSVVFILNSHYKGYSPGRILRMTTPPGRAVLGFFDFWRKSCESSNRFRGLIVRKSSISDSIVPSNKES